MKLGTIAASMVLVAMGTTPVRAAAASGAYVRTADGIVVTPAAGVARKVRLEVVSPSIIHVTAFPGDDLTLPASLMAVRTESRGIAFTVRSEADSVALSTGKVTAVVQLHDGRVAFEDPTGKVITAEVAGGRELKPVTLDGEAYYEIRQQFESTPDEAFYGLGQHQTGIIDYKGKDLTLAQHNMDVAVPFVVSSRDYGILWDNNSVTRFGDPKPWEHLTKGVTLYDAQGKKGGLTASYYVDGKLVLQRTESDIDYQYVDRKAQFPASFPPSLVKLPHVKVLWTGKIAAQSAGLQTFSLYGSDYQKLWIGGHEVIDAWRQNWNPWFRDFSVAMSPGKPLALKMEWDREGGYLALLHRAPRPQAERDRLSLSSEAGQAID